jgi:hypothetical protein
MAARTTTRNVRITDEAKRDLEQYRRELSVRVQRDVTHSTAIQIAVRKAREVERKAREVEQAEGGKS